MIKVHEGAEYVDINYLTEKLMEDLEGVTPDEFLKAQGSDASLDVPWGNYLASEATPLRWH